MQEAEIQWGWKETRQDEIAQATFVQGFVFYTGLNLSRQVWDQVCAQACAELWGWCSKLFAV